MAKIATYTATGALAATAAKLDKAVFAVAPKDHQLLKQAYLTYLANGRLNLAVTKTRGAVSGGGKKPWRQKGTGRARFGSTRNPIWRGGGVAFGPTGLENYQLRLSGKAKRLAVRQALSLAADAGKVIVVEDITSAGGKTAEFAALLSKLGVGKQTVIAVEHKTNELERAAANLSGVKLVQVSYLSAYDVLRADSLVFSQAALKGLSAWLGGDK